MASCGECQNGGFCNITIPACICPTAYIGAQCQIDPSKNPKNRESLTLLPVAIGVVIMYTLCFMIMYLNTWKTSRQSRARQAEIDGAAQVDGPPHLTRTSTSSVGVWRGNPLRPSTFFLPFVGTSRRPRHTSECQADSLPGVSTAPATLQGGMPPKYSHIAPSDDDLFTVDGSHPNLVPPSYEEAIRDSRSDASVIMMHSIPSQSSGIQDSVELSRYDSSCIYTACSYRSNIGDSDSIDQQMHLLDDDDPLDIGDGDLNPEQPTSGILVTFSSPLDDMITQNAEGEMRDANNLI